MDTGVIYQEFLFKVVRDFLDNNPRVEMVLINDSCEAFSMFDDLLSLPRTLLIGSSVVDVMSTSTGFDSHLQLSKIDLFSQIFITQIK